MYAKITTLFVALAAASTAVVAWPTGSGNWSPPPPPPPSTGNVDQCNVSNQQCCNQVQSYNSTSASLIGLLGADLQGLDGSLGISCSPLPIMGMGSSCQANPVCCTGNNYNGLIVIGCSPLNSPLF